METKHCTETPEYWEQLAREQRAFAEHAKRCRTGSVESIKIYLREAREYEAQAERLRQRAAQ